MINSKDYIISEREAIKKALCMPTSLPDTWKLKELEPIGQSKFKGDNLTGNWSVNDQFEIGKVYPIYEGEEDLFVVGADGGGKKMTPKAWGRILYFD